MNRGGVSCRWCRFASPPPHICRAGDPPRIFAIDFKTAPSKIRPIDYAQYYYLQQKRKEKHMTPKVEMPTHNRKVFKYCVIADKSGTPYYHQPRIWFQTQKEAEAHAAELVEKIRNSNDPNIVLFVVKAASKVSPKAIQPNVTIEKL